MSEENVEIAQRAYAAFQRSDLDGFLACVHPEAEWYPLAHEIEGATHGHDGVRLWWAGLFTVFPDLNPTIAELQGLGDFVLVHLQGDGSGAGSEVGIDLDLWQALEMRGGRIVWYCASRTEEEALDTVRRRSWESSR